MGLCPLGGRKDLNTVLSCQEIADEETIREALAHHQLYRSAPESTHRAASGRLPTARPTRSVAFR